MIMFDEDCIKELLLHNKGTSLVSLWLWAKGHLKFKGDLELAKQGFFYLAAKFMDEGILKLARDGKFLSGTTEEQLDQFREAWPKDCDENVEEKDIDNLWWLLFAPAGAVWIYSDGFQAWT